MRRVRTATCTSGDPVSPSCVRFSCIISAFCSATANFSFLLFIFFSAVSPIQPLMLPHVTNQELGISNYELALLTNQFITPDSKFLIHSGGCGAKPGRLRLRLSHHAPRASGGMIHHPNTSVERIAAVSACKTAREAFHALATTSAGSQAGGGFGGLVKGWMLKEIWDMSLLCLRYCILPWTCSTWPRTAVSSR